MQLAKSGIKQFLKLGSESSIRGWLSMENKQRFLEVLGKITVLFLKNSGSILSNNFMKPQERHSNLGLLLKEERN